MITLTYWELAALIVGCLAVGAIGLYSVMLWSAALQVRDPADDGKGV